MNLSTHISRSNGYRELGMYDESILQACNDAHTHTHTHTLPTHIEHPLWGEIVGIPLVLFACFLVNFLLKKVVHIEKGQPLLLLYARQVL